ncbi:MAG: alpha/beta hydrolase [Pseudomonadales bacterium]|nr:alpha/beta hydrolase [Pseudomonadales bacterium]
MVGRNAQCTDLKALATSEVLTQKVGSQDFFTLRLTSSRLLAWSEFGRVDGLPVVFFHSSGSSRLEARLFHEHAQRAGIRLIAVDRPGIGWSEFYFSTTPEPFARDLIELLDHLKLKKVSTLTLGHGAVYALALAQLASSRISGQISLGAIPCGPLLTARKTGHIKALMHRGLASLVRHGWSLRERFDRKSQDGYIEALRSELCSFDQRVLNSSELRRIILSDRREALFQGPRGVAQDESIGFAPFDYQLANLSLTVEFWQGRDESCRHGRSAFLLAAELSKGRARAVSRQGGYFFFIEHSAQILGDLTKLRVESPIAAAA